MEPNKKTLFLFTNAFPCDITLEKYIEHELPYLVQSFKKVYILPSDFKEIKIPVPKNVEVFNIYSPGYYKGNIFSFLENLPVIFSLFFFEFFKTCLGKLFWLKNFISIVKELNSAVESSRALLNILNSEKLDKNECVFYSYWFYHSSLILSIAQKKGIINSFVSRGHQSEIYEESDPGKNLFKNVKLEYVNKLYLISRHALEYIKRKYPFYSDKLEVSYLGVKDNGINPVQFPDNNFTIVSCSKYAPHKRIHLIPEILKQLPFNLRWVHFGFIPDDVISEFNNIIDKSSGKIKAEFKGDVPNEEIMKFYKNIHVDVFINVSLIEGLSVALMEACSFGITLIAIDINGTSEIVNKKSGYLLPLNFEIVEAVEIISGIYSLSEYQKRENSRNMFLSRFDSDKNFPEFIQKITGAVN